MNPQLILILLIPVAYLLGSVPFGLLLGKMRGIDVRKAGSGNIGATNVGRLLGRRYFWIAFGLDLAKGLAPMLIASTVVGRLAATEHDTVVYLLWIGIAAAAVLGHVFSIFLAFHGGKGVATFMGVSLGLFPYFTLPAIGCIAVFGLMLAATRYVSVGSISAAVAFPIFFVAMGLAKGWPVFGTQLPLFIFALAVGGLVILRHRGNIKRLIAGTESHIAWRSRDKTDAAIAEKKKPDSR